jgi:hypothetical protein
MNADRMISVFLAGVLVGGTVVYLAPNKGLAVGLQSFGAKQGGSPNANGGAVPAEAGLAGAPAAPAGDQGAPAARASAEDGVGWGVLAEGESMEGEVDAAGLGEGASAPSAPAGTGPGSPGSQVAAGMGGGMGGPGGGMGGPGGGMGGPGGMGGETTIGSTGLAGGAMTGGGQPGAGGEMTPSMGASPVAGAPKGATRLLRHLQLAPALWKEQAEIAQKSTDPAVRALAGAITQHAASVPEVLDRLPPNSDILPYLLQSTLLLQRMELAGMEVSALKAQVDEISRSKR